MAPALEVTVIVGDPSLRREIHQLNVVAEVRPTGGGALQLSAVPHVYPIEAGVLDDGRTSFVVRPGPGGAGGFTADVDITALDAGQRTVADVEVQKDCSGDGCNFVEVELKRRQQPVDGWSDVASGDIARGDAPRDARVDRARDRRVDIRLQGKTCSANGVTFTASAPPTACGTISLTVSSSSSYPWVLARVRDASGNGQWTGPDADHITCCYDWPFPALKVPCAGAPPFSFSFMKDAEYNNPAVGTIVATCTP
jgi:hypothetical protein